MIEAAGVGLFVCVCVYVGVCFNVCCAGTPLFVSVGNKAGHLREVLLVTCDLFRPTIRRLMLESAESFSLLSAVMM